MMRKRVLLTDPIHEAAVAALMPEVDVSQAAAGVPLSEQMSGVHGIIVRRPIPGVIERALALEVIGRHGVGLDYIPVDLATSRGIPVVFAPEASTQSTAEHAVGLMLALAKRLHDHDVAVRGGNWAAARPLRGVELSGKVVGIVGLGRIGARVAQICRLGFGMEVIALGRVVDQARARSCGARTAASLPELLQQADFVSLHAPLNESTRGLIGLRELRLMKPTAYLINTARGALVDEDALAKALAEGWIAGAGLDVLSKEPPDPRDPLFSLGNVIITAHAAAHTEDAVRRVGLDVAADVLRVLRGEKPLYLANPNVWDARKQA